MKDKLKIVGSVSIYTTENNYHTYRAVVVPIKEAIVSGKIKVLTEKYLDDFQRDYYPCTKEKSWGSNLDEFSVHLNKDLTCELVHNKADRYSRYSFQTFIFRLSFKLPVKMLPLFKSQIEHSFRRNCIDIMEKEITEAEEKRIKEIGENLLKINL